MPATATASQARDGVLELALKPLYPVQRDFVLSGFERLPSEDVSRSCWVAGRGSGKTLGLVARVVLIALRQPGCPILVTEPTWRDVEDVFLRAWREVVPQELWSWTGGQKACITLRTDPPTEIDVRSRHSDNPHRELFRGPTYGAAIHDELAKDAGRNAYDLALATLRHPRASWRSCDCISTPKIGWFRDLAESPNIRLLRSKTSDSPYGGAALDRLLRSEYSREFALQELDAEWVALVGRVFSQWSDALYPIGNRHPLRWDPSQPWQLWIDFGLRKAAWLAVQTARDGTDVVVAEWLSDTDDLGTREAARRVYEWAGSPPSVVYHDPAGLTRDVSDRDKGPRILLEATFGNAPIYQVPSGWARTKEIQIDVVRAALCDFANRRRLCVSTHLISDRKTVVHDETRPGTDRSPSGRGVLDVMRGLTWDDARHDERLRGNPLEHVYDALCYGCVCRYRPRGGVVER